MKFLSFMGRASSSSTKRSQDLRDFKDLSNHESFSVTRFRNLMTRWHVEHLFSRFVSDLSPDQRAIYTESAIGQMELLLASQSTPSEMVPHARLLTVLEDAPQLRKAALEVIESSEYPKMMALEDRSVLNPVWNAITLSGTQDIRSITDRLRGHMFLAVAEPPGMNPHLYCYRSDRWNAYLLPFFKHEHATRRPAAPHLLVEEHVARRYRSHAVHTKKFVVSVKRNEEHPDEWWLYVFEFYNLILPEDFKFSDNHRWLDLERLSDPYYREAAVNGDIIRAIRSYFGTGLHGLERSPIKFNEALFGDS